MNWINVDDKPIADITIEKHDGSITVLCENYPIDVNMMFAVRLKSGEYKYCFGYIDEQANIIQHDEWETVCWGYGLDNVTHYAFITKPE